MIIVGSTAAKQWGVSRRDFENRNILTPEEFSNFANSYEFIIQEGGGEGEYCYGVFKFNDILYKCKWSYYSYEGYNYDGAFDTLMEVKEKQKTITIYE